MDEYELMAKNLEDRQTVRYDLCKKKIDFWQEDEVRIHTAITALRNISKTYDPDANR